MSDPARLWDALKRCGYRPHGQPHDYRSRCPGHDGDNPDALHVTIAADGTVLLNCFAHGCPPEDIVTPLSLRVRDLFPVEVEYPTTRLPTARREQFSGNARQVADVLLAVERLGMPWSGALWLDECPNCEWPWAQLTVGSTGELRLSCQRGCSVEALRGALAEQIRTRRRAA